jgi:hypothetical protein
MHRRQMLTGGLYSLAALTLPAGYATAAPAATPRRAGSPDVTRINAMAATFADADDRFGGGHARTALAAYLAKEVAPMLAGTGAGRARPALFASASRLAYLAGWMAADAGHAGTAQNYYLQSVKLATEAGDATAKATALRGLAQQAVELGHYGQAVQLAEHAATNLQGRCDMRVRAWMAGMCAEAHAANGDQRAALNALRLAEADVERSDSPPAFQWTGSYRRESLEHQTGLVLARLADLRTADHHLRCAIAARPDAERRTRALVSARLARVQAQQRQPEAAAATILGLADDLPLISSARVSGELAGLRTEWRRARTEPKVEEADRLLAGLRTA